MSKINTFAYPMNNSYSFNITKNIESEESLAGFWREPAKKVKIISEPYKLEIKNIVGNMVEYEFVNVEYNGEQYRILNNFHKSEESMLFYVDRERQQSDLFDMY